MIFPGRSREGAPIFDKITPISIKKGKKYDKMVINENKYDLLLQNNASKEFFVYSGLTDASGNHLYYRFDTELDVPDGEYTYAVLTNNRDDVEYDLNIPLLMTVIHTGEGDVLLRDLQPDTGLLQIGDGKAVLDYDTDRDNDTIFYYDN